MLYRLNSEILIGSVKATFVTDLTINSSWETLTDTATIMLPNKLHLKNTPILDIIKVNDPVEIKIGYFPELVTRFKGYVSKIVPESPLIIHCEDEAFQLKQLTIDNYAKNNLTLEELINDNYSGPTEIVDANIGNFRINNATFIQVLQELRSKYKLYSWFRDGVLTCGVPFSPFERRTKYFDFQRNVINGKSLQYTTDSELRTVAYGVSKQGDGTKIELYAYYIENDIFVTPIKPVGNLNKYSIENQTRAGLEEILRRWLPNLHYTGYKGSFEAFGAPVVRHGDVASLTDKRLPERNGDYLIKGVQISFGQGGYRQSIELDRIVT